MVTELSTHHRCVERINANWGSFQKRRSERLVQQDRHGVAAERVAENILEDLFTEVLDWQLSDINNQLEYADLVLTSLGVKHLLIEVKKPGSLAWHKKAVEAALEQARRYADEQKVKRIAVSDGVMLYAADIQHGGLHDRIFVSLEDEKAPECLWWLSLHGIYRECDETLGVASRLLPEAEVEPAGTVIGGPEPLLHPKYRLPASCFAYVGNASETGTWKLPFRNVDGTVDAKRLPKAIQAILSNYRGVKVSGIPEKDIPDVLDRLAKAAAQLGKMPGQSGDTAPAYQQLAEVLEQLGHDAEKGE